MQPIEAIDPVNIAGVVVRTRPEESKKVAENLIRMKGVEVHAISDEGNLVVTVEESSEEKQIVSTLQSLADVPGVIATSLVYSHSDDNLFNDGEPKP